MSEFDDESRERFDLFISYAHADDRGESLAKVTSLVQAIRDDYRRVTGVPLRDFFDIEAIRTMDDWESRILLGLRQSKMMVAVLSPAYFASAYCRKEWEYYLETELAHALPGHGIAPIYVIKHPDFEAERVDQRLEDWVGNLKKRQYLHWLDYWPDGAESLQKADAQRKINGLTGQIVERLGRAAVLGVNHHVPRPSRYFVGRRDELHRLRTLMIDGQIGAISAVHGIGGIGKSTLAFAYAWGYGFEYPGGRFLIEAAGQTDLAGGMIGLAEAKGVALTDEERQRPMVALARVKKAFEDGPPALIVIDNLDDPALLGPQSVERSLPRANHVHVLATTRISPDGLPRLACLPLDALTSADGQKLLNRFRPIQDSPLDDEWKAALEIVNRLAGHALAIEVVGVYLRENLEVSYRQFAETLAAEGISLLEDEVGPQVNPARKWHPESCVACLLEPTLAALTPEEWRVVEYAAQLPPDNVPYPWLRVLILADFPDLGKVRLGDKVQALFRRLERLRLLVPATRDPSPQPNAGDKVDEQRLARMHRLVQDVILRRSGPEVEAERRQIVIDHVLKRSEWIETHWGKPGLEWELFPLRDMALRMIEQGDPQVQNVPYEIARPLQHIGRSLDARTLWRNTRDLWERLLAIDPENEALAREISVCDERLGGLALSEGDAAGARRYFEDGLAIRRRLSEGSPGNADYARDLWISFWKIAQLHDQIGDQEAALWWRRAWETLDGMKRRGMHLSPGDQQVLKYLEDRFGFGQ